ncbi:acetate--CoA ligase family protein [Helicobacter sp. 11S02629-2]|uniref:acetate--CoA ligase family protein n=1 Tax=Helicobacter sp. 11S02629-2 TaxID=1476195 RepID=UPI002151700A|nr:acetate--CoA ligase family protein [Helicobacter sp. 11S02629-2]
MDMNESQLYEFLGKYGIRTPKTTSVGLDSKISFDKFPAVIKIQSPKVVHKSDVGGVVLNLRSNEDLERGRKEIIENLKKHNITLDSKDGFIITEMVDGEELYIGCVEDNTFGHVILFGKGGIYLELYKDVCYVVSDATEDEIIRALNTTKIAKLFEGFRGSSHTIKEAVSLIQSVQKMLKENDDILELDLNPLKLTASGLVAVDARIKRGAKTYHEDMKRENRPNFLDNKNVAIIGASTEPDKAGYAVAKNALNFTGNLYYVNAKGGKLFGHTLYKSVDEIPCDNIDTAAIAIPAKFVIPTVQQLIKKGLKNLVVITAGFKESGHAAEEEELARLIEKHNINAIGPNCLGFYSSETHLNLTFGTDHVKPGSVSFLSQSGAILAAQMDRAYELGIGFSHLVSVGNAMDLRTAEFIPMFNAAPECKAISVYVEGVNRGRSLCNAIRACKKPVFLFKSAKSEASAKAAFSHTGNLSGNYAMFEGVMQSLGVNVVDNLDALILAPLFKDDKKIAIITNAGGPGTVLTDGITARGRELFELSEEDKKKLDAVLPAVWPRSNPIDIIGDALKDRYENALKIVDEFEGLDLIYMIISPQDMTDPLGSVEILVENKFKHKVVPILMGGSTMDEARRYCLKNKILYFDNIVDARDTLC